MFSPKITVTSEVGELKRQEEKGAQCGDREGLVRGVHMLGYCYPSSFLRHLVYLTLCLITKGMRHTFI